MLMYHLVMFLLFNFEGDMETKKRLKPKQIKAVALLARGESKKYVAETLQITTMTIHRWYRLPEFTDELKAVSTSETGLEATARMLNAAGLTAVETAQEIMCCMSQPVEIRLKAAQVVLRALVPANAAIERGLKHRFVDFNLEDRWGTGNTFDGAGKLIDRRYSGNPSVRSPEGSLAV